MEEHRSESDTQTVKRHSCTLLDASCSNVQVGEPGTLMCLSDPNSQPPGMPFCIAGITNFYNHTEVEKHSGNHAFRDGEQVRRTFLSDQLGQKCQEISGGHLGISSTNLTHAYKMAVNGGYIKTSDLPHDHLLESAVAELSLEEALQAGLSLPGPFGYKTVPNFDHLQDVPDPDQLTSSHIHPDPVRMLVASTSKGMNCTSAMDSLESYTPFANMTSTDEINPKMSNLEATNFFINQRGLEHFVGYSRERHSNSVSGAAIRHHTGMHTFTSKPTTFHVQRVNFPLSSFQQELYLDGQSASCLLPQHLEQACVDWQHHRDDRYCRRHPSDTYQQPQNGRLKSYTLQANGAVPISLTTRKWNSCLQAPFVNHVHHVYRDRYWNNDRVQRRSSRQSTSSFHDGNGFFHSCCRRGEGCALDRKSKHTFGHGFSARKLLGGQAIDTVTRTSFPEKILTKCDGVNLIKSIRSGSAEHQGSLHCVSAPRKMLANGQFFCSYPVDRPFHLDYKSSCMPSSSDISNSAHTLEAENPQYNSVDDVVGRIDLMAKDQDGCRFLQRKLSYGTLEDVSKIFTEVIDHVVQLMTDPFGNYLIQKLLEVCSGDQLMQIICAVTENDGDLIRISCDTHGTRAVQKVIETLKTTEQNSVIVSSLRPDVVMLIKDMNGNHVAQRCLQYLFPEFREFLFDAATTHCLELGTDRFGCCVLQKCLEISKGVNRINLMSQIISNALVLTQDQYGNYVVQLAVDLGDPRAVGDILDQLQGSFGYLSMQKYSSHVVEKFVKHEIENYRIHIMEELINSSLFSQILQDPFGNYVIQTALSHSQGTIHDALLEAIRPHIPALRISPFGKKVISQSCLKNRI